MARKAIKFLGKTDPWGSRCRSTTTGKFLSCESCDTCKRRR